MFHTIFFALKAYLFATNPAYMRRDTFSWRFMKEYIYWGMMLYAFNMGSALFSVIGLRMTSTSDFPVYLVALDGDFLLAMTVISTCRAMLSLQSLAAIHDVAPSWLLNHAELSRVHWTRGNRSGEILVNVEFYNNP
ncbi:hypothetical protein ID866_10820 [Astraeus odoratus]|nr:hypothetical protein ID866_10820 [Astraeus odoratus]